MIGTTTHLTNVDTVMFPVNDQDAAIAFYTEVLGFELRSDIPFGDGDRWVDVGLPGGPTTISLVTPPAEHERHPGTVGVGPSAVDAAYAALKEKGATVGDVMRMGPPVPAMFHVADP